VGRKITKGTNRKGEGIKKNCPRKREGAKKIKWEKVEKEHIEEKSRESGKKRNVNGKWQWKKRRMNRKEEMEENKNGIAGVGILNS
jgi:hypothetical protein